MIADSVFGISTNISFDDEKLWRTKWLQQRIFLLNKSLSEIASKLSNGFPNETDDSNVFDLCSRTRQPPQRLNKFVSLNPIQTPFRHSLDLLSPTHSPIIPIWKDSTESTIEQTEIESNCNPLIKNESSNEINETPDMIEYNVQENDQPNLTSASDEEIPHTSPKDLKIPSIPKYVPRPKKQKTEIPVPSWTKCEPMKLIEITSNSIEQLHKYESKIQMAHINIEIIQKRISTNQVNLPNEKINSVSLKDMKIQLTCDDQKLPEKYRKRTPKAQIPPIWESRPYDSSEDHLKPHEIPIWDGLQKSVLNQHMINEFDLASYRQKLIRTTNLLLPQTSNVTDDSDDLTDEFDFEA